MCSVLVSLHCDKYSEAARRRFQKRGLQWIDLVHSYTVLLPVLPVLCSVFSKAAPSRRQAAGGEDKWRQDEDKSLLHHFDASAMFFDQLCTNTDLSLHQAHAP